MTGIPERRLLVTPMVTDFFATQLRRSVVFSLRARAGGETATCSYLYTKIRVQYKSRLSLVTLTVVEITFHFSKPILGAIVTELGLCYDCSQSFSLGRLFPTLEPAIYSLSLGIFRPTFALGLATHRARWAPARFLVRIVRVGTSIGRPWPQEFGRCFPGSAFENTKLDGHMGVWIAIVHRVLRQHLLSSNDEGFLRACGIYLLFVDNFEFLDPVAVWVLLSGWRIDLDRFDYGCQYLTSGRILVVDLEYTDNS